MAVAIASVDVAVDAAAAVLAVASERSVHLQRDHHYSNETIITAMSEGHQETIITAMSEGHQETIMGLSSGAIKTYLLEGQLLSIEHQA